VLLLVAPSLIGELIVARLLSLTPSPLFASSVKKNANSRPFETAGSRLRKKCEDRSMRRAVFV
jgi:hypothetical protein